MAKFHWTLGGDEDGGTIWGPRGWPGQKRRRSCPRLQPIFQLLCQHIWIYLDISGDIWCPSLKRVVSYLMSRLFRYIMLYMLYHHDWIVYRLVVISFISPVCFWNPSLTCSNCSNLPDCPQWNEMFGSKSGQISISPVKHILSYTLPTCPQEEFETGIMKIKGIARSFDLNKLQQQVRLHFSGFLSGFLWGFVWSNWPGTGDLLGNSLKGLS